MFKGTTEHFHPFPSFSFSVLKETINFSISWSVLEVSCDCELWIEVRAPISRNVYAFCVQTMSCLITASWSVSVKTRCVSQCAADLRSLDCLEIRMKCSAGYKLTVADWISGCAWCSVLIKCLGDGALMMHNYF